MISLSAIAAFFLNTKLGQCIAAAGLILGMFWAWLAQHDNKVRTAVYEKSEKVGKVANAKAAKAHDRAAKPGAAERLRKSVCRDCD